MSDNAGLPAYPWGEHGTVLGGLTKRELIAAMSLQGILSNSFYASETGATGSLADAAVYHADDLLRALATANRGERNDD